MKKLITILLMVVSFGAVAQVDQYTSEGQGYTFLDKILKDYVLKNDVQTIADSAGFDVSYQVTLLTLSGDDSVYVDLPDGSVTGQTLQVTLISDGGKAFNLAANLYVSDTVMFDDAGEYWYGMWNDSTWVTLQNSASLK